jgi:hypothetical protein
VIALTQTRRQGEYKKWVTWSVSHPIARLGSFTFAVPVFLKSAGAALYDTSS